MPDFMGGQGAGIQGLYLKDDKIREEFKGGELGAGTMPGMQKGFGKGVTGDAPPNPARRG